MAIKISKIKIGDNLHEINSNYWGNYNIESLKTINGESILVEGGGDINPQFIEIEYSDLLSYRDNNKLIPGRHYRITDYNTTTTQPNTESANHQFDIIVTADGTNSLSEVARSCFHDGDNYFSGVNLGAWELYYCLDNNTNRFAWADSVNGKGVIYYMKDEFGNEAPYDFKNIQFKCSIFENYPFEYAYTFSDVNGNDLSSSAAAHENTIKPYVSNGIQNLNHTIFIGNNIHSNALDENNYKNIIWVNGCYYNNIGNAFQNNIIASQNAESLISFHNNTIGNLFKNNRIRAEFNRNYVGNTTTSCDFFASFAFNEIGHNSWYIDVNYPISYCKFGSYIQYCIFNNTADYQPSVSEMKWCTFGDGLEGAQYIPCCQKVTFEDRCLYNESSNWHINDVVLNDGSKLVEALVQDHDDRLYVCRVDGGCDIFKYKDLHTLEENIIKPIYSNPNLDFESTGNNGNYYGYVGNLYNLNVFGDNILIDSISAYVREGNASPNLTTPVWCRLLKYVNNNWEIVYQSEKSKTIEGIAPETLFTFKMVSKSDNPLLKTSDKIAIVYVSSEDSDILSGVELGFKSIFKNGGLLNVITNNSTGTTHSPAFVFGYTSMASETSELFLGNFSNINDVSSKAAEIDICSNQNITRMSFTIDGNGINYANGFIEQFISGGPYSGYYYIVQTRYFNGETSSRQIAYTINNGVKSVSGVGGWQKIIDYDDNSYTISPTLYSKNSEVVNIGGDQTITGNKRFNSSINIAGQTKIRSDIDEGELKVFKANDDTAGFTIRTNNKFDTNIPKLEMLATNNSHSYKYQFPKLASLDATDYVVVKSQLDDEKKYVCIEWEELVTLRNNDELKPGRKYRITDYVTTTSQENTQSAGHQFDIIVEALSENTLSEDAKAIQNENDGYFDESNLEAWELKYCLDNDTSRFAWAGDVTSVNSENVNIIDTLITDNEFNEPFLSDYYIYVDTAGNNANRYTLGDEMRDSDFFIEYGRETSPDGLENQLCIYKNDLSDEDYVEGGAEEGVDYADKFFYWGTEEVDGIIYDKWRKSETDYEWNIPVDDGASGNVFILTQRITTGEIIEEGNNYGNGVIYYMKDEFNNECPYDFKNIKFYNQEKDNYLFTFSWVNENGDVEDLTLRQDLLSDDGIAYGTHNNIIKTYYSNRQILNDVTFVSSYIYDSGFFYGCHSNSFGNDCHYISFGDDCNNNSFSDDCSSISLGNYCSYNSFGDRCHSNSFGNGCQSNSFGNYCRHNSFGNDCVRNSFSNGCQSNSFGDNCHSNSFGNYCRHNSFGDNYHYNSFGNDCQSNSFGNDCHSNSLGNYCQSNRFSTHCSLNSFGNGCYNNNLGYSFYYNSFGDNCQSNSFGNFCSSNSLGNHCFSNSLGNYCDSNRFGNYCSRNGFYDDSSYSFNESRNTFIMDGEKLNYVQYVILNEGCSNLLFHTSEVINEENKVQNITVTQGVKSIETNDNDRLIPLAIEIPVTNNEYELKIARNTNGDIKMYCEADLIR